MIAVLAFPPGTAAVYLAVAAPSETPAARPTPLVSVAHAWPAVLAVVVLPTFAPSCIRVPTLHIDRVTDLGMVRLEIGWVLGTRVELIRRLGIWLW